MTLSEDKVIQIFVEIDDFYKEFKEELEKIQCGNPPKRKPKMSMSEIMTIMVLFHTGCFRNMKHFYLNYVQKHMTSEFPHTVSYNRFVELMQRAIFPLTVFLQTKRTGKTTGISFIDSTPIRVCKNKRIKRNQVFKGIAHTGKSTMGFFYGFKLHIIINDKGEIISFMITPANVDDRKPVRCESFISKIWGKLYGDKGYISKELVGKLFHSGIHLVTGIKRNMKNCLLDFKDKIVLRKRSVIETVNDELKNICQIEHSRHRSFANFISNTISALVAYSYFDKKPEIKYDREESNQITLF